VVRFCAPRSVLGVVEHWNGTTALEELLGMDDRLVNDARPDRALEGLAGHRETLCSRLMERYRQWLGARLEFLLSAATTARQVCIGRVCTPKGLPLSFETWPGNCTAVTTVEQILRGIK